MKFALLFLLSTLPLVAEDAVNLLFNNPSFEEQTKFMIQHEKSEELTGWLVDNTAYNIHAIRRDGEAPDGEYVYALNMGGSIETAPDSRVTVKPGVTYTLRFSAKKTKIHQPDASLGLNYFVVFYDEAGKKISAIKGDEILKDGVTEWATFELPALAPENAVQAGVKVDVPRGSIPKADVADFRLDNFSLTQTATK